MCTSIATGASRSSPREEGRRLIIARYGHEIPIDDSAAPIMGEGRHMVGVVLIFSDITERRRSERQQSERIDRERQAREHTQRH
jgi:PAS domain S-box-containing protein